MLRVFDTQKHPDCFLYFTFFIEQVWLHMDQSQTFP
jgi:hypothetical protein